MSGLLLIVRLAGERVALPAAEVEAVVEIDGATPVPGAAAHVAGLSALRSRVVTLIDCARSLGKDGGAVYRDAAVAVVDGHAYALLVDSVEDVVPAAGELRPLPGALESGWSRVVRGCIEAEGDLILVLDIPALVAGAVAQAA